MTDFSIDTFTNTWNDTWTDSVITGDTVELRKNWLRFHTLPEGKRYAENQEEQETILTRHHMLLHELTDDELVVIFSEWSNDPTSPSTPTSMVVSSQQWIYWKTILENDDEQEEFRSYRHLYLLPHVREISDLDEILNGVAGDEIAGVMIAPHDLSWLYLPYDGGVDIFASTAEKRDELKLHHADLLPSSSSGL